MATLHSLDDHSQCCVSWALLVGEEVALWEIIFQSKDVPVIGEAGLYLWNMFFPSPIFFRKEKIRYEKHHRNHFVQALLEVCVSWNVSVSTCPFIIAVVSYSAPFILSPGKKTPFSIYLTFINSWKQRKRHTQKNQMSSSWTSKRRLVCSSIVSRLFFGCVKQIPVYTYIPYRWGW